MLKVYDPLQAGNITGDDSKEVPPHDHAIIRAQQAKFRPPSKTTTSTNPLKTLFVGRLNFDTTEDALIELFGCYGKITKATIVRNRVTGLSEGYGFVTFERTYAMEDAYKKANGRALDDHRILVDYEHGRTMKGWVPRRLGGGFGGTKHSGQLRFGGRSCPFQNTSSRSRPPSRSKKTGRRHSSQHSSTSKHHGRESSSHSGQNYASNSKASITKSSQLSPSLHDRRSHNDHSIDTSRPYSRKDMDHRSGSLRDSHRYSHHRARR